MLTKIVTILGKTETVKDDIENIRCIIHVNQKLKPFLFGRQTKINQSFRQEFQDEDTLTNLNRNKWQIYNQYSAILRLYAIYENFAEELIKEWILIIPFLFPSYDELDKKIRNTHQRNVAELLQKNIENINKKEKSRYSHLNIKDIIEGLYKGITAKKKYTLPPDFFILNHPNLRIKKLNELFANAGISNTRKWIQDYKQSRDITNLEPDELIEHRNDAAHRNPNELIGDKGLLDYCDLVENLCQALTELVIYHILERQKELGQVTEIGKITEWYPNPDAYIALVKEATLSKNQDIFLVSRDKAYCQVAKIENIQDNDIDKEQIETQEET